VRETTLAAQLRRDGFRFSRLRGTGFRIREAFATAGSAFDSRGNGPSDIFADPRESDECIAPTRSP